MDSIVGILIVLLCLFTVFYVMGSMLEKKLQIEADFYGRMIMGFLLFLFAFVVVDIPLEHMQVPFRVLAYAVLVVWVCLVGYSVYDLKKIELPSAVFWRANTTFGFLLLLAVQIWYGMTNAIYTSHSDAAYYNMSSITAIYTNTIFEYDQFSGMLGFSATRAQDSAIMLVAVLAELSHMHVLVMVNRVLAILEIVLFNFVLYELAKLLSKGNDRVAFLATFIHFVISLFYWRDGGENLLWGRLAESKSMLANIYIPMLLLCFVWLATVKESKKVWVLIMMSVTIGVALSFSGTYIMLAFAFYLALSYWLLSDNKIETIKYAVLSVAPGAVIMLVRTFI